MQPDFRSREFLLRHIEHTMAFYHPRAIDPAGGFYHFYKDDGTVFDRYTRHLVSSARFVFNYAMAWRQFGHPEYQQAVRHGIDFLRRAHRHPVTEGYAWVLGRDGVIDPTNHCYGLAFVLLAYARAFSAGVEEAHRHIDETFDLMERRFWSPAAGLYADEASADWSALSPYRGQNANMHCCEALIAAFEVTDNACYLERAAALARNVTVRQAALADNLVWEHYRADWSVDWEYNRYDKSNIFRPWGYQPGHLTEWAKLLLILERHRARLSVATDWLLPRARELFDIALARSWDDEFGGMFYGFAPDGTICDNEKYFWVHAESLAAAALLGDRTGDDNYWRWYERLWDYSWRHFVDHRYGAWYCVLSRENRKLSDIKSPAGKTDYHTMGACHEALNAIRE